VHDTRDGSSEQLLSFVDPAHRTTAGWDNIVAGSELVVPVRRLARELLPGRHVGGSAWKFTVWRAVLVGAGMR
jgi:hypothetical protein